VHHRHFGLRGIGFNTYIVLGGDIDFMRVFTKQVYGIPPAQVVCSVGETRVGIRVGEYRRRGELDSASHEAVVRRRDALDQLGIDRRGADRTELHSDAAIGLRAHLRLDSDPAAVAAQGPRRSVFLRDPHTLFLHRVAGRRP